MKEYIFTLNNGTRLNVLCTTVKEAVKCLPTNTFKRLVIKPYNG